MSWTGEGKMDKERDREKRKERLEQQTSMQAVQEHPSETINKKAQEKQNILGEGKKEKILGEERKNRKKRKETRGWKSTG